MPPPVPPLPDDLLEKILLLLPPDDPGCLFRASVVCKPWRTLITDPAFGSRYRKFHGTPPLLGIFEEDDTFDSWFHSLPPTSPIPPVHPGRRKLLPLDSRHGLVIFGNLDKRGVSASFVVWDPIRHRQWELPHPEIWNRFNISYSVAVLCAANGCDHLDCHGGPFLVAYVYVAYGEGEPVCACVYSSEAHAWSPVTFHEHLGDAIEPKTPIPKVLVGNTLYFTCWWTNIIVRYNLVSRDLSITDVPFPYHYGLYSVLMTTQDGALGLVTVNSNETLCLWLMVARPNRMVAWEHQRDIELQEHPYFKELLPPRTFSNRISIIGFAEGVGIFLLFSDVCVFTFELKSGRIKKVLTSRDFYGFPYMSFYTPDQARGIMLPSPMDLSTENIKAAQGEHHVSLLSQPSREARREEEGKWKKDANIEEDWGNEGEKSLEQAQELFDKGSKAIEEKEEAFAINCLDRALNIRVLHCGRLALSCVNTYYEFGYALLYKSQPKSGPYTGRCQEKELDLAWKMLHIARVILEKSPGNTMEKVKIYNALVIISMERGELDYSLSFCSKVLAILKHLVDPDLLQIVQLNLYVCLALVFVSRIGYSNPYCAKVVLLCKSRVQNMENACAGEGVSEKSSLDDEMEFLIELKKTLEGLELAMSTPATKASGEQDIGSPGPRAASLTFSRWLYHEIAWAGLDDFTRTIPKGLRQIIDHVSEVVTATTLTL